jgi:hypothetical protein
VKVDGTSVKHGSWKYFDSRNGTITKTENYILNKLEDPFAKAIAEGGFAKDSVNSKTAKAPVKTRPKEVEAFEKKIGKKKIKVIDGRTY